MRERPWWHFLHDTLTEKGLSEDWAAIINVAILLIMGAILVFLVDYIIWRILRNISSSLAKRTKTDFE